VKENITTGMTIGPVVPPLEFNATQFLSTIRGFETQILAQGWIKNKGILNSLDQKLNAARGALKASDSATAKNVLGAFVNEPDAQDGKGISPEAFALFKFNALYLISQLK
jgi:hypothetical protein